MDGRVLNAATVVVECGHRAPPGRRGRQFSRLMLGRHREIVLRTAIGWVFLTLIFIVALPLFIPLAIFGHGRRLTSSDHRVRKKDRYRAGKNKRPRCRAHQGRWGVPGWGALLEPVICTRALRDVFFRRSARIVFHFDFVNSLRAVGYLRPARRNAGFERRFAHAGKTGGRMLIRNGASIRAGAAVSSAACNEEKGGQQ